MSAAGKTPRSRLPSEKLDGRLFLAAVALCAATRLVGRSTLVTRAVAALIALSGTLAAGLILRQAFGLRRAWLGVLLLTITPAWFLHSRTAFETGLYASLFAWALYAYLRYRAGRRGADGSPLPTVSGRACWRPA